MSHLEPTYLRYIHDSLVKGSIHPENAADLPDGLIGLYEEAFDERTSVTERQKLLNRFAIWALLKKEVSVAFVAEVLEEPEEEIQNFISTYSAWFNSPESGKYQLYHERLRGFVLQKMPVNDTENANVCITKCLKNHLLQEKSSEIEIYALQFLAHHFMVHYHVSNEIEPLMKLMKDKTFWAKQALRSKGHFWTLSSLRHAINSALFANQNHYLIQHAINYLSVELDLFNDLDSLIENLEKGEFEISTNKLAYSENLNFDRFQLILIYIFSYSHNQSSSEGKINVLRGVESYMKTKEKKISLELLPDFLKFDLANFCFTHNIDYSFLYSSDKIEIGGERSFLNKPLVLDIAKFEKFIYHLVADNSKSLSSEFIDSILYTALRNENVPLIQLIFDSDFQNYSEDTAERLALHFFKENKVDEFFKVIKLEEDYVHMLLTLTMRMLLAEKYERVIEFVDHIPNEFYQMLVYFQMAQAAILIGRNEEAESILRLLKNDQRFPKEDSTDLISILELKNYISKYPEEADQFIDSDINTVNHVITALGVDERALRFFRNTKVNLYNLNQININRISKLMGTLGSTDEFITEKKVEIKRNSNALFLGGYNWEDESVLFFIRGLAEINFKIEFTKLFNFLKGSENLGVLYGIKPMEIKFGLLFYLYSNLKKDKERTKYLYIRGIIADNLMNSSLDNEPKEVTRRYLDLIYSENQFFNLVNEKIRPALNDSKISWDVDYHLAKIAEEYLDRGDDQLGFNALKYAHPSRWKIRGIQASKEWEKITIKFLNVFILKQNVEGGLELVKRAINPTEMLHKLSMEIKISDEDTKEKMRSMMRSFVSKLDVEHFDRITREIKHRNYFSALILEAELLHQLYGYKESRSIYLQICENLTNVKNHDDLQVILKKLCQSLVKNHCVEWYSYITNNLYVIDSVVVPLDVNIKSWHRTLIEFRNELISLGESEYLHIVESKIALLPAIKINSNSTPPKVLKDKPKGYYLLPFDDYKSSLYNASSDTMLKSIIRHASFQCFENVLNNPSDMNELSGFLGLKNWMMLGLEMNYHKK